MLAYFVFDLLSALSFTTFSCPFMIIQLNYEHDNVSHLIAFNLALARKEKKNEKDKILLCLLDRLAQKNRLIYPVIKPTYI